MSASPTTQSNVPPEMQKAIDLLRSESRAKIESGNRAIDDGQRLIREGQAKAKMAEELASMYGVSVAKVGTSARALVLEQVKSFLASGNGGRVGHLARHFDVPEATIVQLISQPGSGVYVGPRGWIKLGENPANKEARFIG